MVTVFSLKQDEMTSNRLQ